MEARMHVVMIMCFLGVDILPQNSSNMARISNVKRGRANWMVNVVTEVTMRTVLQIKGLGVDIESKPILKDVDFSAEGRNLLAIMGPSGAGKTTLVNAIAGRQPLSAGTITLSGQPFTKLTRRQLGVVLQEDVFFPSLTLSETLYFTAMIRLPDSMSKQEKLARLNDILDQLDLQSCKNTVVGDASTQGLSGGEKKRASIACELLTDPNILLLDEPTSGLDSSTALSLVRQLKHLSVNRNKIVVASVHQPSSQMYYMFDSLLLLSHGQVAYFGGAQDNPLDYFLSLGHTSEPHYNPADIMMDLLNEGKAVADQIVNAFTGTATRQKLLHTLKTQSNESNGVAKSDQGGHINLGYADRCAHLDQTKQEPMPISTIPNGKEASFYNMGNNGTNSDGAEIPRWPTGFMTQFRMLVWRNFKLSRGRMFYVHDIIRTLLVTAILTMTFYKIPNTAAAFRDRMGFLFFCLVFWTFDPAMQSIITVAQERAVLTKERSSGAYRLAAYFLAKNFSEMTLKMITPTISYTIIYWVTGLNGVAIFVQSLAVLLLFTLTTQGFGVLIGAAFDNTRIAFLYMDAIFSLFFITSGYVTTTFPEGLEWTKYLSLIHYGISALTIITFKGAPDIPCNATSVVQFPKCELNLTDYVTSDDVLHEAGITLPLYCYVSSVAICCVAVRVFAYFTYRWKRPHLC